MIGDKYPFDVRAVVFDIAREREGEGRRGEGERGRKRKRKREGAERKK